MAIAALLGLPETLRDDVTELGDFAQELNLPTDAKIIFGSYGLTFSRGALFRAIRDLYADQAATREIKLQDGRQCKVSLKSEGERRAILCQVNEQFYELPSFVLLSPNPTERLTEFDRIAARDHLNDPATLSWRKVVAEGSLSDRDVSRLMRELDENPLRIRNEIRQHLATGELSIHDVVPQGRHYYERLVGPCLDEVNLASFVKGPCKHHLKGLIDWDFASGLSLSLLVCAHSSISQLVDVPEGKTEEVQQAFAWLADQGDRHSQVAGIEVGVRMLDRFPGILGSMLRIIEEIQKEDPSAPDSRFRLASSLFILVDGELSRRGVLNDKLPFWRRLAAIAQASLLERELVRAQVDIQPLSDWATQERGLDFYVQALSDLRLEPRWLPDFMSPERLKQEAISRMVLAGEALSGNAGFETIHALLKGDGTQGLRASIRYPQSFLPGPLEGNTAPTQELPPDFTEELRDHPPDEPLSSRALAGLVNAALVFKISEEHSSLAVEALKKVRHQVALGESDGESFSFLAGLATVAAVTRNPELAQDVRILARVIRRRVDANFDVNDILRIGLLAAAANADLADWCKAVGQWLDEISYEKMSRQDAGRLIAILRKLCTKVPELWNHCSKADAAFAAVAARS